MAEYLSLPAAEFGVTNASTTALDARGRKWKWSAAAEEWSYPTHPTISCDAKSMGSYGASFDGVGGSDEEEDEDADEDNSGDDKEEESDEGDSEEVPDDDNDCVEKKMEHTGCGDISDGTPECMWCDEELSPAHESYECWKDNGRYDESSEEDEDMYAPCWIKDS